MSTKHKSDFDDELVSYKHSKLGCESALKLETFLEWCKQVGIYIDFNKVDITQSDTSHNIGMLAKTDIEQDSCIVRIPKKCLLESNNTDIKDLLNKNKSELKSESNWAKLVLSLMYESNKQDSKWKPYLDLFPNYEFLDLPMFWEESVFHSQLENTCVVRNVEIDLVNMKNEFENVILPFIKKHKNYFHEKCQDFEYYKKLVAFIMAYSFTDPNDSDSENKVGPMMVPVADILNHIAKNNAEIRFKPNELQICTNRFVKKNEEIYNTYGEHSNTDLLHMYGFTEQYPDNIYDNVEIPSKYFLQALKNLKLEREELIDSKYEAMIEIGLIDEAVSFIIGNEGVLNEEEILQVLHIISMSSDEFQEFCDNDYELVDESDEDENFSLTHDKLNSLPLDWKLLLAETCDLYLSIIEKKSTINDTSKPSDTRSKEAMRDYHVHCLIDGHKRILQKFKSFINIE